MHWELDEVERPFVEQLTAMGWRYVAGGLDQRAKTGRASSVVVVQEGTLRRQLYALNLRDVAGVGAALVGRRTPVASRKHHHI
jgi:type I restriction enzyme, R subunit